jgi:hypothetical protein
MGSYTDKTFDPTQKEILAVCDTREEALRTEMFFHELYDVARNPAFANRAKQMSTGFACAPEILAETNRRRRGQPANNRGVPHSEETKKKISEKARSRKRRPQSEETKKKIAESMKGKKNSLGNKHSGETKQKQRDWKWWVNNLGETTKSKECPGTDWQQGRKFKGEKP